jgi:hypothetical protein
MSHSRAPTGPSQALQLPSSHASEEDERLPPIHPLQLEARSELTACAYDRPDG